MEVLRQCWQCGGVAPDEEGDDGHILCPRCRCEEDVALAEQVIATTTTNLLTTDAAARALSARLGRSMSARRVQQLVLRGDFPGATRPARDWMIPRASVEAWQPRPSGRPGHRAKGGE